MLEHPFFQAVAAIMVLLLVLAWWFPNQRWLDPFRAQRFAPPPPLPPAPADSSPSFHINRAAPIDLGATLNMRIAARQRAVRRFGRIHAGVSIVVTGIVILFGHYVMARMTGSDPEAEGRQVLPMMLAALFVLVGAGVLFVRDRER